VGIRRNEEGIEYQDHLCYEGVVDAGSCEDGCAVVEEVVPSNGISLIALR
jgi:hypothetical protein